MKDSTSKENQEAQFNRIVMETIREAREAVSLDKGGMERLLHNGGKFKASIIDLLVKYSSDSRFSLLNSFHLAVPKGYDHNTQLADFAKFAKQESENFRGYSRHITDANYAKVTHKLIPGRTYGVKFFQINTRGVTSEECLEFLASQGAILVGAQGISLARQLYKDQFPVSKFTASLDEKDALWVDDYGDRRVPLFFRGHEGCWYLDDGSFRINGGWHGDYCLICFYDLS